MLLAGCGFILSATAHCLALANAEIPGGKYVWGLHIGIFVVWLPAVLICNQATRIARRRDLWKQVLGACPGWMRWSLYAVFGYGILNFIYFVATTGSQHFQMTGDAPDPVIRGFSGHWMIFYGAAFAIFYSRLNAPQLYSGCKCPLGHTVSPLDRYCPECGSEIEARPRSA